VEPLVTTRAPLAEAGDVQKISMGACNGSVYRRITLVANDATTGVLSKRGSLR
jgi:hypothetical protein